MTTSELRRGSSLAGLALLSGALLFWTALRSSGGDWFISETHADIIYTGIRRFREFPFFSFVLTGGAYLLQDPQSNVFSPVVPLVLLAGPTVGLRLMEGLWGVLGVYVFVLWMRKRVSLEAALLGAVASVTGLGVLWKVAVGNDMFIWHLGLPGLLWAADKVASERNVRSALIFGLVLGVLLLGPTFHSFTYLFLPAVPLYVLFDLGVRRPKLPELARTLALYLAACGLAVAIASPKLACWRKFPMSRPIADFGVLSVGNALRGLLDYSLTKFTFVDATSIVASETIHKGWGVQESAAALAPVASLLALAGLWSVIRSRTQRPIAIYALLLIAFGMALTCSWPFWSAFRTLTGGNFRVAPRFMGLASFGVAILVAVGADAMFRRWKRVTFPATLALAGLMLASGVWWTLTAAHFTDDSEIDCVNPEAINPLQTASDERAAADSVETFGELTKMGATDRAILDGIGYQSGLLVVGNKYHPRLWRRRKSRRSRPRPPTMPVVVSGIDPKAVSVSHLSIVVNGLPPQGRVHLRALMPSFGVTTTTEPPNRPVEVRQDHSFLLIENNGQTVVDRIIVRADLPISKMWFVLSLASGLGALLTLLASSGFFPRLVRLASAAVATPSQKT